MAHRFPALGAVLWFVVCAVLADAQTLQTFNSTHYAIHTDMDRQEVREYGRHMDAVFAEYQRRFQKFRSRRTGPMPLILFAEREGYIRHLASLGIPGDNSGGMFFIHPRAEGLATWTGGRSRSETFEVLQHEGFHQFAHDYLGRQLPIWANEGLAQYFEDGVLVRGTMQLGLVDDRRLAVVKSAIASNTAIPLSELLSITNQEWGMTLQMSPARSMLLYAQSWSLIYFLVHADNQRYREALTQYLQFISSGHDSARAFEKAFGVTDPAPVERRWRAYITQLEPDPVTSAVNKLEFLGRGMLFALEEKGDIRTFRQLRKFLQERQFTVRRVTHGQSVEYSAKDNEVFRYVPRNGRPAEFELVSPSPGMPPGLSAPGLVPEPTLVWIKDASGELVSDIAYR